MARLQGQTLSFLNKDDEERFIPKGDYKNALNIRRRISSGGTPYPAKNIKSTLQVNFNLPAGDNICIGETSLEENNSIYFFIYNSNSNHSIYQYNTTTNVVTLIVQDSFLNFSKTKYITGVNAVLGLDGDGVLLYWTDDFNPPRKINVKRAILHNQGDFINGYNQIFSTGTDSQKAKFYDAIKHPPLFAPTFRFTTNPNISTNNIEGKVFQFRYRYIYDDGERSAYSPWSELAVSDTQKLNSTLTSGAYSSDNNEILIFFTPSDANNVKEIELTYREGNSQDEKLFERLDNTVGIDAAFFSNSNSSTLVNTDDSIKTHDAVPLLAKAQEFKENTLYYGNYVDGFDNVNMDANIGVQYNEEINFDNKVNIPDFNVTYNSNGRYFFGFDLSGITVNANDIFFISSTLWCGVADSAPAFGIRDGGAVFTSVFSSYVARPSDTIQDVVTNLINNISIFTGDNKDTILVASNAIGDKIEVAITNRRVGTNGTLSFNGIGINNDSYKVAGGLSVSTPKAGAYHPLGVVYFDRGNRPTSVQRIGNPYVKWFTERDGTLEGFGSAGFGVNIKNTPPVTATHYALVYAGNNTVDEYLQYTVQNVFQGAAGSASGVSNSFDRIYLSLKNFEGQNVSWKESTGALPSYNFVEGDRVRIKSYINPTTNERVYAEGYLDFKVLGYEILPNDDSNPLITSGDSTETKKIKSGQFLIIENPKITNWDIQTGLSKSTGYWFNDTAADGAEIEIYRPKQVTEDIPYYEFGETYEIGDAGLSSRYHKGKNRNQNESLTYSANASIANDTLTVFTSDDKLVVGDTIRLLDSLGNQLLSTSIVKIEREAELSLILYVDDDLTVEVSSTDSIELISEGAASYIEKGDSWYKPRIIFNGTQLPSSSDTLRGFSAGLLAVEDYYVNDFIRGGNSWDRGRAFAYSPDTRRLRYKSSVTNSEPYFPDTNYNGLSAFNPTKNIFRDYDQTWGGIQIMKQNNQGIILWQEDKVSKILIDRNILESAEGGQTITISEDKLGTQIPYSGDYGIGRQPESLCGNDGRWYWIDIKRGAALRLSLDGITPISDYKLRYFFLEQSDLYLSKSNDIRILGGFDPINGEAVFTFPSVSTSSVTVNGDDLLSGVPNSEVVGSNFVINTNPVEGTPNLLTMGNEERNWEDINENWEDWGGNLYDLQDIAETGNTVVSSSQLGEASIPAYARLQTATQSELTRGELNTITGELSLPTSNPDFPSLEANTTEDIDGFTLGFYEPANRWSSFYSFTPELYSSINSLFISFKNGGLHLHEKGDGYNNFYGVNYKSLINPVINDNPFDVKSYYAAWIEGSKPWDTKLITNLNETEFNLSDYVDREGRYYSQLPFSNASSSTSNIIGVGEISAINGNVVTIDGFTSGMSGIFVGDSVFSSGSLVSNIASLSGNNITLGSVGSLSVGDFIYVQRDSIIDGDRIRGYYVDSELSIIDSADEVELFSFDVIASKSFR